MNIPNTTGAIMLAHSAITQLRQSLRATGVPPVTADADLGDGTTLREALSKLRDDIDRFLKTP